ncbi:response regulator [Pseudoroseicyclus sp. CXY001]|uniref:response regulator n=1 Tax=Pseudoroseicyclus sp. CXY001 TaxID=3242492 RepID=UPI0035712705
MSLDPIRVLMVEDNPADAELAREVLETERLHLELTIAVDGQEALEILSAASRTGGPLPDLIFLDLNVPRVHGKEVLAEIKRDGRLKLIPVVILTSSSAEQDIVETYELGANCYVTKPVDLMTFQKIIQTMERFWFTVVKLPPVSGGVH